MARIVKNSLGLLPSLFKGNAVPAHSLMHFPDKGHLAHKFIHPQTKDKLHIAVDADLQSIYSMQADPSSYVLVFDDNEKSYPDLWLAKKMADPSQYIISIDLSNNTLHSMVDNAGRDPRSLRYDVPLSGVSIPVYNIWDYIGHYALFYYENGYLRSLDKELGGGSVRIYPSLYAANLRKQEYPSTTIDSAQIVPIIITPESISQYDDLFFNYEL